MEGGTIERVHDRGEMFYWKLERFSERVDYRYVSPVFYFCSRKWFLGFYPNGEKCNQPEGYIGLELWPYESDTPIRAQYSLGIRSKSGTEVWKSGENSFFDFYSHVWCTGIERSELFRRRDELLPLDVLTISVMLDLKDEGSSETDEYATDESCDDDDEEEINILKVKGFTNTTSSGTTIEYNPPTGNDIILINKENVFVQTILQCITCMALYQNMSLEELRAQDYDANRKGKAARVITSKGITQQADLFGKIVAISTSGFSFGNSTQRKPLFVTTGATGLKNVIDVSVQTAIEDSVTGDGKGEPTKKTGPDKIVEDVGKLWPNGDYTDVVLKVRDAEFNVHKTILVARTPVLGAMFQHETAEKASGEASIDDCDPEVFEQLLHYIYKGVPCELTAENASALYVIADKYLVGEVKALCVSCMMDSLCLDTFCDTLTVSLTHREDELLKTATDFLSKNMIDVMKTVNWQNFMREHPTWANEILIRATQLTAARYEKDKRDLLNQSVL